MVTSIKVAYQDDGAKRPADIFQAAASDDPSELQRAISEGQNLDLVDDQTGFNPIMVALLERSEAFLAAAMNESFDPWYRDPNERLAIDHANALGMRTIQKALYDKMYPPGWADHLTPQIP